MTYKVWALGALRFNSIASVAKRITCTVAPLAYQKGPLTPYEYATEDDWSSVAAQVQEETTADDTKPDLTDRPAVLKASLVCNNSLLYRFRTNVVSIIPNLLRMVSEMSFKGVNLAYANRKPSPTTMP